MSCDLSVKFLCKQDSCNQKNREDNGCQNADFQFVTTVSEKFPLEVLTKKIGFVIFFSTI